MNARNFTLGAFAATLMLGSLSLNASAQDRDRYVADDDGDREQAVRIIGPETETPKLGFEGRMTNQGLRIERVLYNSLAYDAGLEQGDVISRVNGVRIESMQDYQRAMIEARDYHNGRVQLRIDNVRWHSGESGQRWVNRTVYLPRLDRPDDFDGGGTFGG